MRRTPQLNLFRQEIVFFCLVFLLALNSSNASASDNLIKQPFLHTMFKRSAMEQSMISLPNLIYRLSAFQWVQYEPSYAPATANKSLRNRVDSSKHVVTKHELGREMVNVNTATVEELARKLKGIGDKKAQDIVEYREKNGLFRKFSALYQVPGITKAIWEQNRQRIVLLPFDRGAPANDA